ncbi:Fc.00g069080.m01.CDS01 [Cosmosporella sp. VM-42]
MATRRIVATEKTILDKDETIDEKSNIGPAVPRDVIIKLLAFTFAMIVVPIGSYFATVHTIFKGTFSHPQNLFLLANSSQATHLLRVDWLPLWLTLSSSPT